MSIGAPGNATPLRSGTWPSGITDAASIFGRPIDPKVLSRIPIQLVVGDEDKYHPIGTEGTPAPLSRLEVLLDLAKSYDQAGLEYELVVKTGVRHEEVKLMSDVQAFVSKHLRSVLTSLSLEQCSLDAGLRTGKATVITCSSLEAKPIGWAWRTYVRASPPWHEVVNQTHCVCMLSNA